jgi:predicted N-acetyltransferase YhbS
LGTFYLQDMPPYPIGARPMSNIVPLETIDPALIEALLDRAFEPARHQRTAYKVREGTDWLPALSFAALDSEDRLAGTIQCWPVALTPPVGRASPMVMVGPVAVLPELQGHGYGKALMMASTAAFSPDAPLPQVMIGDPEYYGRFWGFTAEPTTGWTLPGAWEPRRLLVRCDNPSILPKAGMLGPWLS